MATINQGNAKHTLSKLGEENKSSFLHITLITTWLIN